VGRPGNISETIRPPLNYPTSLIYVDESGTVSNDRFFVVGALKVRRHGQLMRSIRSVRDRRDFHGELRFNRVGREALPTYIDIVDQLVTADVHFAACIVDRLARDPFAVQKERWRAQATVTVQLLRGCINQRELVSLACDTVSTPPDVAFEDVVRRRVNRRFGSMSIVTAAMLDSRSSDGLQLVDLVTGATAFQARRAAGLSGNPNSHKARLAGHICAALGVDTLCRGRSRRTNIGTYGRRVKHRVEIPSAAG